MSEIYMQMPAGDMGDEAEGEEKKDETGAATEGAEEAGTSEEA